jgi:hypothetical protein
MSCSVPIGPKSTDESASLVLPSFVRSFESTLAILMFWLFWFGIWTSSLSRSVSFEAFKVSFEFLLKRLILLSGELKIAWLPNSPAIPPLASIVLSFYFRNFISPVSGKSLFICSFSKLISVKLLSSLTALVLSTGLLFDSYLVVFH